MGEASELTPNSLGGNPSPLALSQSQPPDLQWVKVAWREKLFPFKEGRGLIVFPMQRVKTRPEAAPAPLCSVGG